MGKKSDYSYVRVTVTVPPVDWGRTRGIGYNLKSMEDVSTMFENLVDADLSGVSAIRIKPTEVNFSKPNDIARGLDGVRGRSW